MRNEFLFTVIRIHIEKLMFSAELFMLVVCIKVMLRRMSENQAICLTTDSLFISCFSPVRQAGFTSMFKSSSKRTACAIAFAVACVPTIALGEGILSFL